MSFLKFCTTLLLGFYHLCCALWFHFWTIYCFPSCCHITILSIDGTTRHSSGYGLGRLGIRVFDWKSDWGLCGRSITWTFPRPSKILRGLITVWGCDAVTTVENSPEEVTKTGSFSETDDIRTPVSYSQRTNSYRKPLSPYLCYSHIYF